MNGATVAEALRAVLPLKIREVQWNDPTLTLAGNEWSFSLTCPWRVVGPRGLQFAWSDPEVEDHVWDLVGAEVVAAEPQPGAGLYDPVLRLTGDLVLEVFCDTGLDPWTLHLPDGIFVGPLEDSDWGT